MKHTKRTHLTITSTTITFDAGLEGEHVGMCYDSKDRHMYAEFLNPSEATKALSKSELIDRVGELARFANVPAKSATFGRITVSRRGKRFEFIPSLSYAG